MESLRRVTTVIAALGTPRTGAAEAALGAGTARPGTGGSSRVLRGRSAVTV